MILRNVLISEPPLPNLEGLGAPVLVKIGSSVRAIVMHYRAVPSMEPSGDTLLKTGGSAGCDCYGGFI